MAKKEEPKKPTKHTPKPRVHQDLNGLEVSIDQFGELKSNMDIEKINEFLNKNVDDKKLAELAVHFIEQPGSRLATPKKRFANSLRACRRWCKLTRICISRWNAT